MATLSRLLVELGLDSSGFTKGVDSAKGAVGKLGGSFGEMAKGVAGGMLAASVVSGGFGEIKGQVEGAIHAGEEFQQTQLKTNAIFGKGAEEVTKWGEGAATSLGMSGGEAQKSADIFGNLFRNIGFTSGSLPGMSEKMTGVVANLAAFNNADPAEVMNAVGKAVVGSTKGLKQYGIVISQADIAQEALRETGKKSAKDLTTQEKTQAAYNLILDKTKNIQGSVADRSKTLAGASKILHAELANLQEEIGVKLLPVLTQLTIVAIKAVPILMAILTRFVIPLATALVNKLLPSLTLFWNATKKIIDVMILAFKGGKSFSDLLERIPGPLKPLAQALITIAAAVGDLVRAFQAGGIQGLLAELPKALGMLGDGFAQLGTVILGFIGNELQSLVDAFAGLLDKIGLGDFGAAIQAEFGGIVTFIGDEITLIGDLIHGRWGKLWGDLKTLAIDALRLLIDDLKANLALIMDAFRGIDWGDIGSAILSAASAAFAFLLSAAVSGIQALAGLDWAGYASDALSKLSDLGGNLLQSVLDGWDAVKPTLIKYASGLVSWILGQVPAVGDGLKSIGSWLLGTVLTGWDEIKPTLISYAQGLPDYIVSLVGMAGDGLKSVGSWLLGTVLTGWDAIKPTLIQYAQGLPGYIVSLVGMAGEGLASVGSWLLGSVLTGWDNVKPTLIAYASGLPAWVLSQITDAGSALLIVGNDLLHGILNGWDNAAPLLRGYAVGLCGWVLSFITDAPGKLLQVGNDLLHSVLDGWDQVGPTLQSYAAGLCGWVLSQITDAPGKLLQVGKDLLQGVVDGWNAIKPTLQDFATGLGDWVKTEVGDLGGKLYDAGSAVIQGLKNGAVDGWTLLSGIVSWLQDRGSHIVSAIGDLGGVLYQAGLDVMQGLHDGIQWAWDNVVAPLLSKISKLIPSWKGPPARDRTMLIDNGRLIMAGLGQGIGAGMEDVKKQLGSFTANMPAMLSVTGAATSGGNASGSGASTYSFGDIIIQGANKDGRQLADEIMAEVAREIGLKHGV